MFTGIVTDRGQVVGAQARDDVTRLVLRAPRLGRQLRPGGSVAVNGVCLTVVGLTDDGFTADVMALTAGRSTLGRLAANDTVNLEPALRFGDPVGGHLVQGHVDGTAAVLDRRPGTRWLALTVQLPGPLARYVAPRGAVCLDGVSLTVAELTADSFTVGLVPTTLQRSNLADRVPGDLVNLEVDLLARYLARLVDRPDRAEQPAGVG